MLIECIWGIYQSIKSNKLRTVLNILSVATGAWLIIIIICIGNAFKIGVKDYFYKEYASVARVVNCEVYEMDQNEEKMNSENYALTETEIIEYLKNAPDFILDLIRKSDYEVKGILGTEVGIKTGNVQIKGVSKGYFFYDNLDLVCGRFISERDCLEIRSTVVVSRYLAENMFGKVENALGKQVYLLDEDNKIVNMVIVGVIEDDSNKVEIPKDYVVRIYCSYSYMNLCYGTKADNLIDKFRVLVKDSDYLESASAYTNSFLKARFPNYNNYRYEVKKFNMYEKIEILINIITLFFVIISLTTLVVAGVGTANVMFASVVERTVEIGIKRAIGATQMQIRLGFMMEASVICLVAGILSVILGDFTCDFITKNIYYIMQLIGIQEYQSFMSAKIVLHPSIMSKFVAISFSLVTGIVAGYIPAIKAAKMEPVKALRFD